MNAYRIKLISIIWIWIPYQYLIIEDNIKVIMIYARVKLYLQLSVESRQKKKEYNLQKPKLN